MYNIQDKIPLAPGIEGCGQEGCDETVQTEKQLPEMKAEPYKTFICYRGESVGNKAGQEISSCVRRAISGDPYFAPVFWPEDKHYDFISELKPLFRSMQKFVVILTVDFFSDFFIETEEPGGFKENPESATLQELKYALANKCEPFVVFSGEFSWKKVDPITVRRLETVCGRDAIGRLRHVSNTYTWSQEGNPPERILDCFKKASLYGIRSFLNTVGPDTERRFEETVTGFASRGNNNNAASREYLRMILEEEDGDVAYAAFYMLQVMLRRLKEFRQMRENFEKYGPVFSSKNSYSHIWVLYQIESGEDFDADDTLRHAEQDCIEFPNNAGFIHLFADVYATACERAEPREREEIVRKWGEAAEKMADRAIELDSGYAKYYCTKARIHALRKDYRTAERCISQAIDKEDSNRADYQIRLLNYQYHKTMIQVEKKLDQRFGRDEL